MAGTSPTPNGKPRVADADLLGDAVAMPPPGPGTPGVPDAGPGLPDAPVMPKPPPAEDENQPGFIGERNRPAP